MEISFMGFFCYFLFIDIFFYFFFVAFRNFMLSQKVE
jgi:hypothetical protein